jgi:hypothetical protein
MVKIPDGAKRTWETWGHFAHAKALLETLGMWEWTKTVVIGAVVSAFWWIFGFFKGVPPVWLWAASVIIFVVVGFIAAMFFAGQAISQMPTPIKPKEIPANRGKREETTLTLKPSHNVGPYIVLAAIILVGGAYALINWPTQLQYAETKLVFSFMARPPIPEVKQFLGFDVIWIDSGPLDVSNVRYHYKFRMSRQELLTNKEIGDDLDDVKNQVPQRDLFANELSPRSPPSYVTMQDEQYNMADWTSVRDGKSRIYMFAVFKYDVEDKAKVVYICLMYDKDFPAVHECFKHAITEIDTSVGR